MTIYWLAAKKYGQYMKTNLSEIALDVIECNTFGSNQNVFHKK